MVLLLYFFFLKHFKEGFSGRLIISRCCWRLGERCWVVPRSGRALGEVLIHHPSSGRRGEEWSGAGGWAAGGGGRGISGCCCWRAGGMARGLCPEVSWHRGVQTGQRAAAGGDRHAAGAAYPLGAAVSAGWSWHPGERGTQCCRRPGKHSGGLRLQAMGMQAVPQPTAGAGCGASAGGVRIAMGAGGWSFRAGELS